MAVCDYCGTSYRGGYVQHGKLRFCTGVCRDHGAVLALLDEVPPALINDHIDQVRAGPCRECGAHANTDMHKSYRVWSALVITRWRTLSHFCCQACGRKHQIKGITSSALLGWWGIPFGLLITPLQIYRNLRDMLRKGDRASPDLERTVRIDLAQRMAAARTD